MPDANGNKTGADAQSDAPAFQRTEVVAGALVIGALVFLVAIDRGFRSVAIRIGG